MSRRSQLEMVGLIFIIIIVIFGMMIYTIYKASNPHKTIKRAYVNKEMATNLILAMERVNVAQCPDQSLSMLLIDCASSRRIICGSSTSCDASRTVIEEILYTKMPDLGKNFSISVGKKGEAPIIDFSRDCAPRSEIVSGFQSLTIYQTREQLEISLRACDS